MPEVAGIMHQVSHAKQLREAASFLTKQLKRLDEEPGGPQTPHEKAHIWFPIFFRTFENTSGHCRTLLFLSSFYTGEPISELGFRTFALGCIGG